jgi:putative spermidine/putrescine transport system permease protein
MIGPSSPAPVRRGSGRKTTFPRLLCQLGPSLLLIAFLFGGGLLLALLQALDWQPFTGTANLTPDHFLNVLQDFDFVTSLALTLYISTVSTAVAATVSILLSLAVTRWAPESRAVSFILQIPLSVPHLVLAISVLFLLSPAGLLSRLLASLSIIDSPSAFPLLVNDTWSTGILVVYIWKEIPFITLMLLSVLKTTGTELLEAGATLHANSFQRFVHITLPLIAPSLAGGCLIVFAFTFGAFEVPYLLGRSYPLMLPVWSYKLYSDIDLLNRPEGIAAGLLIAIIIFVAMISSHILLTLARKRGDI